MKTPFVLFCLAAAMCGPVSAIGKEPALRPIRIVTYNAEILRAPNDRGGQLQRYRFSVAREAHLERVAGVVEVLDADVFNLVEVVSKKALDRVVEILHEKGMTEYRGYHVESNDGFSGMDVGVITKLPLDEIEGVAMRTLYSEDDDPKYREPFSFTGRSGQKISRDISLSRNSLYYLTIRGHKLAFFGLHLKSNPQDEYSNNRRQAEARIVRRVVAEEIYPRGYLPILLGDLNDYDNTVEDADDERATSTEVMATLKDLKPDAEGDELFNVAEFIPRKADRFTSIWDRNENGAEDPYDVFTMIDHILLPQELRPYVKRAFIAKCSDLSTSDHLPVVVDLNLPIKK